MVETYTRPSGSSFALSGRGYGHGRGMSQYGAYGAAQKGLTRDEILAFYYPNTTRSTAIGNPTVRVRLTALGTSSTTVVTQPKLVISDGTKTGSLYAKNSDGTLRTRWRVVPDGKGLTLQWLQKRHLAQHEQLEGHRPSRCRSATRRWARCGWSCPTARSATTAAPCAACAPAPAS